MRHLILLSAIALLVACASQPVKPDYNPLVNALISQDRTVIIAERGHHQLSVKNDNIINLYLLMIDNKPSAVVANSKLLIENYHQYSFYQQQILKPILLWAYLHPIYRRETGKDIRILQREELLVAPSNIDFSRCIDEQPVCANLMRGRLKVISSPYEINQRLTEMANNDPCINLTKENMAGDFANKCLANRKGDLKINLLSPPNFLADQWLAILEDRQALE
ncbi:hypothetical protein [Marinicella gelatinilytica]|uniref:hypothetical protein n=1 Tax=Marinicella gelatinilytica TaxID=2996017 RepID=UPI002260BE32|nr:hypothetical protein [Marinicella gelatinilytica]MCX7545850.1 hypothetical protein [Marinicella gelatinilytica]